MTVEECIEHLCNKGCQQVRETIEMLEAGRKLAETQSLSDIETAAVLAELKSIMAVYGDMCRLR